MPWWAEKNPPSGTVTLQQSAASPGADWVQVPGATDSMTEAQAEQVLANYVAGHALAGVAASGYGSLSSINPFAGITDVAHAIAAIGAFFLDAWKAVTDGKMWRSLGWLLLGVILLFAGIRTLTGRTPLPAPLPPLPPLR